MQRPKILKQKPMQKVMIALTPVILAAVYFFGLRVLAVLAVCSIFAFLTEWIMASKRNGKVTQACFVTAMLYGLALPPTVPFWMAAVGIIVGILFGKEAFGGFGKNVFNPAIVGRAFVWICFPVELTSKFVPAFNSFPGGFTRWSMGETAIGPAFAKTPGLDATTSATPMFAEQTYDHITNLWSLFTGQISGIIPVEGHDFVLGAGSMGEVSALAILTGAAYLIYTKAAQVRLMLSPIIGALAMTVFMKYIIGAESVPDPAFVLLSGGLLYAAVFMVTEPVSAPNTPQTQWIYGIFIGVMIVLLRYEGIFTGAVAFSILLGNMLAPSLDLWKKRFKSGKAKA